MSVPVSFTHPQEQWRDGRRVKHWNPFSERERPGVTGVTTGVMKSRIGRDPKVEEPFFLFLGVRVSKIPVSPTKSVKFYFPS